jgi:cytochrome c
MGFRPPQGVNPLQWRRENANRAKIKITPASGLQDIYFIFKNPAAKGEEILMGISEIQFMNQIPAPAEESKK